MDYFFHANDNVNNFVMILLHIPYFLKIFSSLNFVCPRIVFAALVTITTRPQIVFPLPCMRGISLQSRVGSLLIKPRKPPEIIAGSDKGSGTNPFADLDKDEDLTEEN